MHNTEVMGDCRRLHLRQASNLTAELGGNFERKKDEQQPLAAQ